MKRFLFHCGTRESTASIGILLLRMMVGLMMLIGHGIPKIQQFSEKKDVFPTPDFFPLKYMSSSVSLTATITAEALCATLIIFGVATRPAAFILGFTMVVAAFEIHGSAPWFGPGSKELALMYLIPMISIILSGSGLFSIDAILYKEGRRRRLMI